MTRMWHRDMKWINAAGKMAPIELLNTGLPQTSTCKRQTNKNNNNKNASSVNRSKVKHNKMRDACGWFPCWKPAKAYPFEQQVQILYLVFKILNNVTVHFLLLPPIGLWPECKLPLGTFSPLPTVSCPQGLLTLFLRLLHLMLLSLSLNFHW